jgi:7-carboxy-7-deazaguanine synthase
MRVFEIFRSLQGETTRAGVPMDFVRLAGCDLACTYCDTPAAREEKAGREMTVAQVLAALPCSREHLSLQGLPRPPLAEVMITGGEPLLQAEDVNALVVELVRRGREVMVETSGAHPIDLVDARARRIVDVKTPGSGMADRMDWRNLERLTLRDEVKFVLTGRPDYDWAKEVVESHGLVARCPVLFGSAWPLLDPKALAGWLIEDALAVRLNLQIHKMLGLP